MSGVVGPGRPQEGPAVLDADGVDRALSRLAAEHEAVETSLLALQDHSGRRLLEGAALTGVTKERWAAADAAITRLWTLFDAYSGALRAAREIRERRRRPNREDLVELTERLCGPGVLIAGAGLEGAALAERMSLAELVARMNELYASSLDVVVAADAVWSALPARIDLLAVELHRTRSLARSVGIRPGEHPSGDDLEEITAELTELRARVIADPLAFWSATAGVPPRAAAVRTPRATTGRPAPWTTCAGRSRRSSTYGRTPNSG